MPGKLHFFIFISCLPLSLCASLLSILCVYRRCHATMCAVSALHPQRFRGFGPSSPQLLDQLCADKERTRFNIKQPQPTAAGANAVQVTAAQSGDTWDRNCRNVIHMPLYLHSHEKTGNIDCFADLDRLYELSADTVAPEIGMSAQVYGSSRLKNILKTQKEMNSYQQGPMMLSQRFKNKRKRVSGLADDDEWRVSSS